MRTQIMTLAAAALAAAPALAQDVYINEIRISEPGADDNEFFELTGAPGTSLDGLSYVVLQDDGRLDGVIDLTGKSIPSDGFFLCAELTLTAATADLTASLPFENSENTNHLVVSGITASQGDDLDVDDDGVLDSTPWTAIIDSIAVVADLASVTDPIYVTPLTGPDGSFFPGAVFREDDATTGLTNWAIADFGIAGDTPGAANATAGRLPADFGGGAGFGLNLGSAFAGEVYLVVYGFGGSAPGTPLGGGLTLPVNLDALATLSIQLANTGPFSNTLGTLDADGKGNGQLILPSGITPSLAGSQIDFAALTVNPFTAGVTSVTNNGTILLN
ncbi:MAG: hypothetical protein ACYSWX_03690 [Planctomycetota bacterium]|jgi:hypothetical protein